MNKFKPIEPNNGPGPVPWDRNVELEAEVGTGYFLDSAKAKSSAASHSSVVNDHGDARQLSENRRASTVGPSGGYELSTADWVAYSGARFTHADNIPELKESDITAQDETSPPGEVSRHNLPAKSAEKEHLGDSIRNAFQKSAVREGTNFLPIDALERIVTKDSVREELANVTPVIPPEQLDKLTDQIWEVTQVRSPLPSKTSSKKTTRRKIFAILALMKKVSQIVEFVKEDLYDSDLPFKIPENPHKGLRQLERKGEDGNLYSIQLSAKWEIHELEYFDNFQWQFLAPYFQLSTEKVPKILHYNLENRTIMPFIEDHEVKHTGGYGDVWKVKIHPAHHNHCEDSVCLNFT